MCHFYFTVANRDFRKVWNIPFPTHRRNPADPLADRNPAGEFPARQKRKKKRKRGRRSHSMRRPERAATWQPGHGQEPSLRANTTSSHLSTPPLITLTLGAEERRRMKRKAERAREWKKDRGQTSPATLFLFIDFPSICRSPSQGQLTV